MSKPASGDVWRYDYLWRWQHQAGETEGRKSRPSAFVAVVADSSGKTNLFILPITSVAPAAGRLSFEVPEIERRRAGLDNMRLWVMLDEYNHDQLETSYYFDPAGRIGAFGNAFHQKVLKAFLKAARERRARRVSRTE